MRQAREAMIEFRTRKATKKATIQKLEGMLMRTQCDASANYIIKQLCKVDK